MKKKHSLRMLACLLVFISCFIPAAVFAGEEIHLNGTAYDVLLTVNGLPMEGTLARADASEGWRLMLQGTGTENIRLAGEDVPRTWVISMDLKKEGLTSEPNGLYTGRISLSITHDMQAFDDAVFELVREERGRGADFDAQDISGWYSHDSHINSQVRQVWSSNAHSIYISGLEDGEEEKSLAFTLSYLPVRTTFQINHRLYYQLAKKGELYEYTVLSNAEKESAEVRFVKYTGDGRKELPEEPVFEFDLSPALHALEEADMLFSIKAS